MSLYAVWAARWSDVDPARHPFDPSGLRELVGSLVPARSPRAGIEGQIDTALLATYGTWITGWNWAASEPQSGGLVRTYCCEADSLLKANRDVAIESVVNSVHDWRTVLDELATMFRELRGDGTRVVADLSEHAAAQLVGYVVERTDANDAWYRTLTVVLTWFLESCGVEDPSHLVEIAIGGRFESWIAPSPESIAETASTLARVVRERPEPEAVDALRHWIEARTGDFTYAVAESPQRLPVTRDAHAAFIATVDRARDVERSDWMAAALAECRASARRNEPLTLELLASWQTLVLADPHGGELRTNDAYARHVRYRYRRHLRDELVAALAQASSSEPVAIRAARVYLDVCFCHPFVDGNARAARLALDHVLTREGLALHTVEPIFMIARAADDFSGAHRLVRMIDQLAGPRT